MGTAPDEREIQDDLPVGRRRRVWTELWRRCRLYGRGQRLPGAVPERRHADPEPEVRPVDGKPGHGADPAEARSGGVGPGLAALQSRRAGRLAEGPAARRGPVRPGG